MQARTHMDAHGVHMRLLTATAYRALAEQAGYATAPLLDADGWWCDDDDDDFDPEYLPCHRKAQLDVAKRAAEPRTTRQAAAEGSVFRCQVVQRLEGHGQEPSQEELASLAWPHCEWWQDRDRIVLLYEYLLSYVPDGSYEWERGVCEHAMSLWSDGRAGTASILAEFTDQNSPMLAGGRMCWPDFADELAPGWRMLASLPSCPNHHMRFPMSRHLLARVRQREGPRLGM